MAQRRAPLTVEGRWLLGAQCFRLVWSAYFFLQILLFWTHRYSGHTAMSNAVYRSLAFDALTVIGVVTIVLRSQVAALINGIDAGASLGSFVYFGLMRFRGISPLMSPSTLLSVCLNLFVLWLVFQPLWKGESRSAAR